MPKKTRQTEDNPTILTVKRYAKMKKRRKTLQELDPYHNALDALRNAPEWFLEELRDILKPHEDETSEEETTQGT